MAGHTLQTPIEYLKGVGPQRAELLKKELAIFTYQDLLTHFPFRYVDRTKFYKVKEIHPDLPSVQILGRIISKEIIGDKRAKRLVAQLKDDTGLVELVWFQGVQWLDKSIQTGSIYVVFGKANEFNGRFSIPHPEIELYNQSAKKIGKSCPAAGL